MKLLLCLKARNQGGGYMWLNDCILTERMDAEHCIDLHGERVDIILGRSRNIIEHEMEKNAILEIKHLSKDNLNFLFLWCVRSGVDVIGTFMDGDVHYSYIRNTLCEA